MLTFILTLILGIILGALLLTTLLLYFLKIKCPACKQLKPAHQIIFFQFRSRTITGSPCLECQTTKTQIL